MAPAVLTLACLAAQVRDERFVARCESAKGFLDLAGVFKVVESLAALAEFARGLCSSERQDRENREGFGAQG